MGEESQVELMQSFNKKMIWTHRLVVFIICGVLYFFNQEMMRSFFFGSIVFNVYLMMLCYSFFPFEVKKDADTNPMKPLAVAISMVRTVLPAAILAVLILKLKLSIIGIVIAFLAYKIVLLVFGLIYASHYRRDTGKSS